MLRHVVEVFLHVIDLVLAANQLLDGLLIAIISGLAAFDRLDILRSSERILTIVQRVSQLIGPLASAVLAFLAFCTRSGVLLFAVLILILFFVFVLVLILILGLIGIFALGLICRLILRRLGRRGGGSLLGVVIVIRTTRSQRQRGDQRNRDEGLLCRGQKGQGKAPESILRV